MKRYSILALALVLGCTLFTGCRRGSGDMPPVPTATQAATEMPTIPAAKPTRPMVTEPATMAPTEDSTANPATDGTMDDAADETAGASEAAGNAKGRTGPQRPGMR